MVNDTANRTVGVTNAGTGGINTAVIDGVSFSYPSNWHLKETENRFTNLIATLDYDKDGKSGQIVMNHDTVFSGADVDTLKDALDVKFDVTSIFESGTDKYIINNQSAPYVIATFTSSNIFGLEKDMVTLVVVVELRNGDAVFAQYVTDMDNFDKLLGDAEQITKSIKPAKQIIE